MKGREIILLLIRVMFLLMLLREKNLVKGEAAVLSKEQGVKTPTKCAATVGNRSQS